jgi:hypothetical protein
MRKYKHWIWILLIAVGSIGIVFNLFQIIVIIAGNYNRNPNITSPTLQTLDAIALTGLWLLVSLASVVVTAIAWKQTRSVS